MYINMIENDKRRHVYRIIELPRLFELFSTKQNVLVKPKKWQDPFENFILKAKVRHSSGEIVSYNHHERIYGQCWSLHKASDAMWRIYSPKSNGIRIRTTVEKLTHSLASLCGSLPQATCSIGRVSYLKQAELIKHAQNTFHEGGIAVEKLFGSLLFKRLAFKHENEVRLLYYQLNDELCEKDDLYRYEIDPHNLISQIMLDPRLPREAAEHLTKRIRRVTGYQGEIKRSLLYALPGELILDARHYG
ncbi:DUF2971 domain-containing protein [Paraburkholderia dipogonis]|uniref:DUF2971 domain-containing protein n=1 Tax=Paraburkholderia dipogonis TaxID=1211383 RepID=A0ABW9AKU5_9BURK